MANPQLYKHQRATVNLGLLQTPIIFDSSDPGTGKTLAHLELWANRRRLGGGKLLVVCPKTLMESAWIEDTYKFYKGEFIALPSYASDRYLGFRSDADITIINTDGVKWLSTFRGLSQYDTIIFDESEAFKHRTSQRSRAAAKIASGFKYRNCLSGTPINKSVTELWHQIYLLDFGKRLGSSFYRFRNTVCESRQVGPMPTMVEWQDKPGAETVVAGVLSDISIRHVFENCVDIPDNVIRTVYFNLSPALRSAYATMRNDCMLDFNNDSAIAVNAAVLVNKLLQIASGAVYTSDGRSGFIASDRYELIIELVKECKQSIVFFEWTHERDQLIAEALKQKINSAVIDGTTPQHTRGEIVKQYQNGEIQVIFAHPKSAGRGLTLTKGVRTIWTHPPYSPAMFRQGNGRIYRIGQQNKTETIIVAARDTIEMKISRVLAERSTRMSTLLELMEF